MLFEVFGAVVEAGVEAKFFDDVAIFFEAVGDADDGLAGLGLAEIEEAHVGGEAGHAEGAEGEGGLGQRGVESAETGAVGERIFLPVGVADD